MVNLIIQSVRIEGDLQTIDKVLKCHFKVDQARPLIVKEGYPHEDRLLFSWSHIVLKPGSIDVDPIALDADICPSACNSNPDRYEKYWRIPKILVRRDKGVKGIPDIHLRIFILKRRYTRESRDLHWRWLDEDLLLLFPPIDREYWQQVIHVQSIVEEVFLRLLGIMYAVCIVRAQLAKLQPRSLI